MTERLKPFNLDYHFFEAVDGRGFDLDTHPAYDGLRRRLFFGRDLTKGELGCLLSHRAIYQHMVDNNIPAAVVLEDDVFFKPDFPAVLQAIGQLPVAWDVIRFLAQEKTYKSGRVLGKIGFGPYVLARNWTTPGGAYAYMLTQNAARQFLRRMERNFMPVDTLHGYVWRTGLETFAVRPSPVSADMETPSTIGMVERFDKTLKLSGGQKMLYPFTRAWLKFSELVCKRMTYLAAWPRDRGIKRALLAGGPICP
jgi:glycosyl transferase family 25